LTYFFIVFLKFVQVNLAYFNTWFINQFTKFRFNGLNNLALNFLVVFSVFFGKENVITHIIPVHPKMVGKIKQLHWYKNNQISLEYSCLDESNSFNAHQIVFSLIFLFIGL